MPLSSGILCFSARAYYTAFRTVLRLLSKITLNNSKPFKEKVKEKIYILIQLADKAMGVKDSLGVS